MKEKKEKEKGKKAPLPTAPTTRDRAPPLAPTPCVRCSARDLTLPRARRAQQPRRRPSSARAALRTRRRGPSPARPNHRRAPLSALHRLKPYSAP